MVYAKNIAKKSTRYPRVRGARKRLFNACGGMCAYCRRKTEMPNLGIKNHDLTATVDHILARSRGGARLGDNLALVCMRCNGLKASLTLQEWSIFIIEHPEWWKRKTHKRTEINSTEPFTKQKIRNTAPNS